MRALHHPARPLFLAALLAAGALALATAAAAAVGSWSPLGPDGESIYGLVADPANPNLVYAATPTSVFRSSDGGDSWTFAGTGLGSTSIRALALSGSAVIVGTPWEGVWRSLDEGRTWRVTTASLSTRPHVNALVVDPRRPERVWLASWEGIFVSDDRGETWTVRNGDLPLAPFTGGVESLAIDPANGQLYARTGRGLFTSSDEGTSWSLLRCRGRRCGSVVVDPADAATLFTVAGDGVFGSSDGGASWQRLPSPAAVSASPESIRWEIVASPGAALTLYANLNGLEGEGVYRSRDAGATWQAVGGGSIAPGSSGIRALAVDPHDPRRLLAGTAKRGIFTFTEP